MKYLFTIILFFSLFKCYSQTEITYFEAVRKDNVFFTWGVNSKEKQLTYIIQASHDKLFFEDIFTYKCENKEFKTNILNDFIYFRLKILISKDIYIYSDVVYCKSNNPIRIFPDPSGDKIIYVTSIEEGYINIYQKNDRVLDSVISEGHNTIPHNLNPGEYIIFVYTENYTSEIKIKIK